ncbi:MAG: diguanylate cyclase and metal dependent phosphohydrolase [Candidatus Sulfotelmatobacter sp.]|nr:diguanylate cyclase and metal dependent phosphohydrolase [Candidatus Sulfotelmatobacter sp.]
MNRNTRLTKTFIGVMVLAATASSAYASLASHTLHTSYALAILALAAATSRMKIKLPGIDGNMSVNLPFLLMAVVNLSAMEAVVVASISTMVQCWPKLDAKFKPEQMLFNVSMMAFATSMANFIWNAGWLGKGAWASEPLMLASATAAFFVGQTAPVAGIIKLAEGAAMRRIWLGIVQLSFPYYVLSAGMTSMVNLVSHHFGWQAALVIFPVMFGVHLSYRLYFGRAVESLRTAPLARTASVGV